MQVPEDIGFVQHVKTFFTGHHNHHHLPPPKPALSEHSTSNPATSSDHSRFHSPQLPAIYAAADPPGSNPNQEAADEDEEEDDDEDEDDDADADADAGESESESETARNCRRAATAARNPTHTTAEPSELMQLEMSEDIRLGSPDDASNNLDSDFHMLAVTQTGNPVDHQQRGADSYRAESTRRWPLIQDPMGSTGLQPPSSSGKKIQ